MGKRRVRGEGSIYQRASDGLWVGVVDLGWSGGRRKRRTVSAKTLRELRPRLATLRREIDAGVVSDSATVEQWLNHWLDDIASRTVRDTTLTGYRRYVANWITPAIGKRRLADLRPEHVRAMLRAMETAGLSDATRRQAYAILRRALVIAVREQRLMTNPAAMIDPPPVGKGTHGSLTLAETQQVLRVIRQGHPRGSRYLAALVAGLRQGEALGLRWEDVDLDRGVLMVRRTVQRLPKRGLVVGEPKSAASVRAVPVLAALSTMLTDERQPSGWVWPSADGDPMDPRRDWQLWRDLLDAAGVRRVPLHAARATTGSLLMAAGVPDKVTAEILGHSQVQVTQQHYLHGDDGLRAGAIASLGALVDGVTAPD